MQGPARGTLCGPVFGNFCKRILKKKTAVLEKVNMFEFVKVRFFSCASDGRPLLVRSWFSGSILNFN